MSIGTRAIGVLAIGAVLATEPDRKSAKPSGAIGTYAIGAGFGIGGGQVAVNGGVNHLIHWRRRGRR